METLHSSQEKLDKGGTKIQMSPDNTQWTEPSPSTSSNSSTAAEPMADRHDDSGENVEQEPLMQSNGNKTDFITIAATRLENGAGGSSGGKGNGHGKLLYHEEDVFRGPEESIQEAFVALFIILFNLAWSIGVGFWHLSDGQLEAAYLTFAIIIASGILTELTYFFYGRIQKRKIWESSKILWIFFLIPCAMPIFMATANVFYGFKEARDPNFIRPWTHSRTIFLVESLTLVLTQSLLQICLLMELMDNFPTVKGCLIAAGLVIFTVSLTFARIRYDSMKKVDRFAMGTEKYIRFAVIWGSKVLWLLTHCFLIVSVRVVYGKGNYLAVLLAVIVLQMIYEIPLLMSMIRALHKVSGLLVGSFFLIPQFAALITLVLWVNVDPSVYQYNIGSCVLGMFFGAECFCIMGWLLDRCTGRENDFIPSYPHVFGNLYIRCCK